MRLSPGYPLAALSPREREVAELYAEGLSYKEVARELSLSPTTVRNQIARCYQKLEIRDKAALIHRLKRY